VSEPIGISPSAFLVVHLAGITDVGDHQAVLDPLRLLFVQSEPGDRTDRAGNEDKSVRVAKSALAQLLCEKRAQRDAGKIVVAQ
jgi:hypothetical protein